MSNYNYFPIIKTRDAELRAFRNIELDECPNMLPIYELTKSRRSQLAPDGNIHKRATQINEIQKNHPFILDITTHPDYENPQTKRLLNPENGFKAWRDFISIQMNSSIVPMIHIHEDEQGMKDVDLFIREISPSKEHLALRLPYDLEPAKYQHYIDNICEQLDDNCSLIILLDAEFIGKENESVLIDNFTQAVQSINNEKVSDIVMLASSFPKMVMDEARNYNNNITVKDAKEEGEFEIKEENLYLKLKEKELPIKYGDYVSINNEQIEIMARGWTPRIDIPDNKKFYYKRRKELENSTGYINCAKEIKKLNAYSNLSAENNWGIIEIDSASQGTPAGKSPSYWISVRMSIYLHTRYKLRQFS